MKERFWLACYDVSDARRLRRVARAMEGFGWRVQKSVFECWLGESDIRRMKEEIGKILDADQDSFRLYMLCETCRDVTGKLGETELQPLKRYFIS